VGNYGGKHLKGSRSRTSRPRQRFRCIPRRGRRRRSRAATGGATASSSQQLAEAKGVAPWHNLINASFRLH